MRSLVIVPALNEERNVARVVSAARAQGGDVLVVDDGSDDHTARAAAEAGAIVVRHACNLGIGAAVQTGYLYALRKGYDVAVRLDADGQHSAADIPRFLAALEAGDADIVVGSRFLARRGYQSTWVRRIGILILSLVSAAVGTRTTDPTSGYWAINRRAIELLARSHPDDYPETEALVLATRAGLRIKEIPVNMLARLTGYSSISAIHSGFYMLKVVVAVIVQRLRK